MTSIMQLAGKYNLQLIEDCAQAHGAKYKGQKVGTFWNRCIFFFILQKFRSTGDAGAITTNDSKADSVFRALRNYGSNIKYQNDYIGYNSRLDEIQAALLNVKLKHLDEINAHKKKTSSNLYRRFKGRFY